VIDSRVGKNGSGLRKNGKEGAEGKSSRDFLGPGLLGDMLLEGRLEMCEITRRSGCRERRGIVATAEWRDLVHRCTEHNCVVVEIVAEQQNYCRVLSS
jgi:hypothetical protein